jgi:hypothetical protein
MASPQYIDVRLLFIVGWFLGVDLVVGREVGKGSVMAGGSPAVFVRFQRLRTPSRGQRLLTKIPADNKLVCHK